jgi:ribonuclease P protein component
MISIARSITQFKRNQISYCFAHATRVKQCDAFVLLRVLRQGQFGRILVITAKKVGNAPERNLLKRRIKSIFFTAKAFQKEFDWVFIARQKATSLSYAQLQQKLLHCFATV